MAVEAPFEYGHMGKTSEGWTYIDDDLEETYEKNRMEMQMNRLGHAFTYRRQEFWQLCIDAPVCLHKEVTAFAASQPPARPTSELDHSDFEAAFFSHAPAACEWQECYTDQNDDDDLMALIRLLRALVEAKLAG